MRHRRKGFTLLELLAVIGIILILMSMAILAYKHVDQAATSKATKATLANCQALLAEYEINTPLSTIRDLNNQSVVLVPGTQLAPAIVAPTDVNPGGTDRNGNAVLYTRNIMGTLTRIPRNGQMISQLPAKSLLTDASGAPISPPVLLDGWKNPILFVPASGLVVNLMVNNTPTVYTVRTSGVYPGNPPTPSITTNDRPFFASAGADGNFTNGDDNIYSFQP
ncbi:MAG: hypothetical protein JWP03_1687 [Phycisphaerales bacterium]|nr:hypothetical protein [Phycisphaerales bacterium]MDB5330536.1 hypothetical protein [Phycisphaerales bacterium]